MKDFDHAFWRFCTSYNNGLTFRREASKRDPVFEHISFASRFRHPRRSKGHRHHRPNRLRVLKLNDAVAHDAGKLTDSAYEMDKQVKRIESARVRVAAALRHSTEQSTLFP